MVIILFLLTNDCRNAAWELQESCQNQHDIEDPLVQHGAGVILLEYPDGHDYFKPEWGQGRDKTFSLYWTSVSTN